MKVSTGNGQTEPASRDITIRDLLLHTAGFGYTAGMGTTVGVQNPLATLEVPFQSIDEFVNQLATQPLLYQPGTKWFYSWSYDVLGYVIEVSG